MEKANDFEIPLDQASLVALKIERIDNRFYLVFLGPKDEDGNRKEYARRPAWEPEWALWKALLAQKVRIEELEAVKQVQIQTIDHLHGRCRELEKRLGISAIG